ncbi:MAG: ABC transporter ATP-binding protein [Acidimicrobiia bacterium]|jgi:branched-chain amino acid transport system ATP-binding protein
MSAESRVAGIEPVPGAAKPDPILSVDRVRRAFGGLQAVDVAHIEIERNTITSLIGPNGAGKTTLFNLLTGFDRVDGGHWHLNGGALVGIPAHQVARKGMVRTFQLTRSLARLTVMENMLFAAKDQRGESLVGALFGGWRHTEDDNERRAAELLERFDLGHMAHEFAGSLSGGQRKLLEMARALMVDPEIIMLDEPMAGVNPALTQSLLRHITGLRDSGKTVVFIEHDMDVVQEISDWVIVLSEGRVIAEGPPDSIARNPDVVDAYLGTHHGEVP